MDALLRIYNIVSIFWLLISFWSVYDASGYLMEKKWKMMKEMYDKYADKGEDKGKAIELKIIPIPIPIKAHPAPAPQPVYYVPPPAMKAPKAKPCKEKDDWLWKLMALKAMKGDKGNKGCCPKKVVMPVKAYDFGFKGGCKGDCAGGCKGKCKRDTKGCSMGGGWPMKAAPCTPCQPMMMMKAAPCPPCPMMMMKGCGMNAGWSPMMSAGWAPAMSSGWAPMMPAEQMCCPSKGGWWPEEEEEEEEEEPPEEEEPDYYEEEQMAGWDTNDFPMYVHPADELISHLRGHSVEPSRKKGDDSDELFQVIKRRFFGNSKKNHRTSSRNDYH